MTNFIKNFIIDIFKNWIVATLTTFFLSLTVIVFSLKKYLMLTIHIYQVLILISIIFLIILIFYLTIKSKSNRGTIIFDDVEVRDKFHTGFSPNNYQLKNKWKIKNSKEYYYIPLIVTPWRQGDKNTFNDFCGPFCNKCNHILYNDHYKYFNCLKCDKKYKIPDNFIKDYYEKVFNYFSEEYKNGNIKDISVINDVL